MFPKIDRDLLNRILLITLGSLIAAVGVQLFLVPAHLVTAGVAGIAVLISFVTPVPAGISLFLMNIPIFLLSRRYVHRDFLVWSVIGTVGFSAGLWATAPMAEWHPVKDLYLNLIFGAVVAGFGTGLVFRARSSQGGTDVIAAALRKVSSLSIGGLLFVLNASVVLVLAAVYGLEPALATVIVIAIESWIIERTIIGIDANKAMLTITAHPNEVSRVVMDRLERGATILPGTGAFTGDTRYVVMIILQTRQVAIARKLVRDIDPDAFTFVQDVTEVIGHGFHPPAI